MSGELAWPPLAVHRRHIERGHAGAAGHEDHRPAIRRCCGAASTPGPSASTFTRPFRSMRPTVRLVAPRCQRSAAWPPGHPPWPPGTDRLPRARADQPLAATGLAQVQVPCPSSSATSGPTERASRYLNWRSTTLTAPVVSSYCTMASSGSSSVASGCSGTSAMTPASIPRPWPNSWTNRASGPNSFSTAARFAHAPSRLGADPGVHALRRHGAGGYQRHRRDGQK